MDRYVSTVSRYILYNCICLNIGKVNMYLYSISTYIVFLFCTSISVLNLFCIFSNITAA